MSQIYFNALLYFILLIVVIAYLRLNIVLSKTKAIKIKSFGLEEEVVSASSIQDEIIRAKLRNYKRQQRIAFLIAAISVSLTIVFLVVIVVMLLNSKLTWKILLPALADIGSFTIAKGAYGFYKDISDRFDELGNK